MLGFGIIFRVGLGFEIRLGGRAVGVGVIAALVAASSATASDAFVISAAFV
jgi:hypothetical protein